MIGSQYIISLRDELQQGVVHFEHMITQIVKSFIIHIYIYIYIQFENEKLDAKYIIFIKSINNRSLAC